MAEKDLESEKLELSLFGRKRRKGDKKSADDAGATAAPAPPADERSEPAVAPAEPTTREAAATPERAAEPERAPADPAAPGRSDDTAVLPPAGTTTDTTPGATSGATVAKGGRRARGGSRVARRARGTSPAADTSAAPAKTRRTPVRPPTMAAPAATLLVGAVVGLAAVAMTFASLKACDLIAGTDSCGGPGLLVLLAVVVLMILGGSAALSMLGVPESGGISFLGVAMFVAVCLVVLLPNLLEPWMIVVAPVLCALTYLAAHWIVTRFDEDILETEGPPQYDVR